MFIDETWAKTSVARTHGRLRMGTPHGHWKTTTLVAGLTLRGMIAPFILSGSVNRAVFETYVEKVLVHKLHPSDIVIIDNLSSHKGPRTRTMIETVGANLLVLPPYKPRLQPNRERLC